MSEETVRSLQHRIAVARGDRPADLALRGGRVLNVFTGEMISADVAIAGDTIAGIGEYRGEREIELDGAIVLPGFIDGHIHIESTVLSPARFTRVVSSRGTTTVVADPHEIANVAGLAGVRYMMAATRSGPVDVRVMALGCVPSTHLETAGATLGPDHVETMLRWPGVHGLAEMMNFPGVLAGDEQVLRKLAFVLTTTASGVGAPAVAVRRDGLPRPSSREARCRWYWGQRARQRCGERPNLG